MRSEAWHQSGHYGGVATAGEQEGMGFDVVIGNIHVVLLRDNLDLALLPQELAYVLIRDSRESFRDPTRHNSVSQRHPLSSGV